MVAGLGFLFIVFLLISQVSASALNRFELNDGSVIQGKILSYSQGVYKINSDVLGTVSLPETKIRSIQPAGNKNSPSSPDNRKPSPGAEKIDQVQQLMMGDPETVQLIQELQNDPAVQEILQDKELMEAITQGNLSRVGTDPKIQELMKNESVGKIIDKNN